MGVGSLSIYAVRSHDFLILFLYNENYRMWWFQWGFPLLVSDQNHQVNYFVTLGGWHSPGVGGGCNLCFIMQVTQGVEVMGFSSLG